MDIILLKILIIALGKYPKGIISMRPKKFIWNAMIPAKLAQRKKKEINIIAKYVKIITFYIGGKDGKSEDLLFAFSIDSL